MNRREFMASMVAGAAMPVLAESGPVDAGVKPPHFKPMEISGQEPRPDFWKVRPGEILELCERAAREK